MRPTYHVLPAIWTYINLLRIIYSRIYILVVLIAYIAKIKVTLKIVFYSMYLQVVIKLRSNVYMYQLKNKSYCPKYTFWIATFIRFFKKPCQH